MEEKQVVNSSPPRDQQETTSFCPASSLLCFFPPCFFPPCFFPLCFFPSCFFPPCFPFLLFPFHVSSFLCFFPTLFLPSSVSSLLASSLPAYSFPQAMLGRKQRNPATRPSTGYPDNGSKPPAAQPTAITIDGHNCPWLTLQTTITSHG